MQAIGQWHHWVQCGTVRCRYMYMYMKGQSGNHASRYWFILVGWLAVTNCPTTKMWNVNYSWSNCSVRFDDEGKSLSSTSWKQKISYITAQEIFSNSIVTTNKSSWFWGILQTGNHWSAPYSQGFTKEVNSVDLIVYTILVKWIQNYLKTSE